MNKKLTQAEKETLMAYADNDMNLTATAKEMYCHYTTIWYRMDRVAIKTGLNPKCFYELVELMDMARKGEL